MIVLTDPILKRIEQLGKLRTPNEACGILLPTPRTAHSGEISQVVELPNRSLRQGAYAIEGSDIKLELSDWVTANSTRCDELAIWHTHPGGNIGPSRGDMRTKLPEFHYLVVALTSNGLVPAWF